MNKNKIFFTPNQDNDNQEEYIQDDKSEKLFKFKQRSDLSLDFGKLADNIYKDKKEIEIDMKESNLLNQGGYGCVYHPAIQCEHGKNKKIIKDKSSEYISKIQFDDKSSRNEIEISNIIKNISNYNNFFAPIVSYCSININRIDKSLTDVYGDKCGIYEKEKRKNDPFIMVSVPYIKDGNFNKNIVSNKKKFSLINLIDTYKHLLNALLLLQYYDIVHYDLKADNILFNKVKKQPVIIDFGLSINFKQINKLTRMSDGKNSIKKLTPEIEKLLSNKFYVFAPDYYLWCIEIHTISYLLDSKDNRLDSASIKLITTEYVKNNKGFAMFDNDFKYEYTRSAEKFLSQYQSQPRDKIILSLLKYYKTWDIFSLNIMYLKMLFNIFGTQTNKVTLFLYKLFLKNVNPDPNKRNTINDTLNELFDLYSNENTKIDEIIKLFDGLDINNVTVMRAFVKDQSHYDSVIESFKTRERINN